MSQSLHALMAILVFSTGIAEARLFTDSIGREVEAELLGVTGENVVLKCNGQAVQWPLAKLSGADQNYVKEWLVKPPSNPQVRVNVWEREGIGSQGLFEAKDVGLEVPKNIPMLKSTEEKAKYRYYDLDLSNLGEGDARNLHVSYVVYVIDAANRIVDFSGSQTVEAIAPRARASLSTEAASFVRTKTTSMTLGIGFLGNLTTGTSTDRAKERFGGIWVRVYGEKGEVLGESKDLHDELERLDFRFTGTTGSGFDVLPVLESFEKLKEFFEKLPRPPGGLPKKPPFLP